MKATETFPKITITGKNNPKFQDKLSAFKKDQDILFDIAACKCEEQCKCCPSNQVPEPLRHFLKDQRSDRVMNVNMIRETLLNFRQNESEIIERHPKANDSTDSDDDCSPDDSTDADFVVRQSVCQ